MSACSTLLKQSVCLFKGEMITEHLSWKASTRIIKSNSCLCIFRTALKITCPVMSKYFLKTGRLGASRGRCSNPEWICQDSDKCDRHQIWGKHMALITREEREALLCSLISFLSKSSHLQDSQCSRSAICIKMEQKHHGQGQPLLQSFSQLAFIQDQTSVVY